MVAILNGTAPIDVLSLGAGVQSSTLALMAAKGEIDRPAFAIFADTKDEPESVYKHLQWLTARLNFPTHTVTRGDLMRENLRIARSRKTGKLYMKGMIPAYILNRDGSVGLLGRKCTADYKIAPLHARIKNEVGREPMLRWRRRFKAELREWIDARKEKRSCDPTAWATMQADALAIAWIGISDDEWTRAKPSRKPWIRNRWPLLERKLTRADCINWLLKNGFPIPPRSACKKCPFHGDEEWLSLTETEFQEAVAYEREMQEAASKAETLLGIPFLHESCRPLGQINFRALVSSGRAQLEMFGSECEGMCGV